ncbi:hypothetical protein DNTS_024676, partial [Danionella cerebrum]
VKSRQRGKSGSWGGVEEVTKRLRKSGPVLEEKVDRAGSSSSSGGAGGAGGGAGGGRRGRSKYRTRRRVSGSSLAERLSSQSGGKMSPSIKKLDCFSPMLCHCKVACTNSTISLMFGCKKYRQQDEDSGSPPDQSSPQLTDEAPGPELVQVAQKNISEIENVYGFVAHSHISPMKVSPGDALRTPSVVSSLAMLSASCVRTRKE